MLHTCRYTYCRAEHIWPICTVGFLTYRQVQSDVISQLSTSKHYASFGIVAKRRAHDPSTEHKLMDCACRRWCGYNDTRRHRTDRNFGNDQDVLKLRPGWTTYGTLLLMYLLLLLPLEAELSISKGSSSIYTPASLHFLP